MITEVFIDLEKVFKGLSHIKQFECTGKFYCWLSKRQQKEFASKIIEYADDDILIDELEQRGYNIKKTIES